VEREKLAIEGMLELLERIYGPYQADIVVQCIIDYVQREVHPDFLQELVRAILRSHPIRLGVPDVAAFELAVKRAEERDESLRRPRQNFNWSSSPVLLTPPTEDERGHQLSMKAQAAALGINVDEPYWMTSYIMHEVERKARENGRMALPGDKRAR
jgi:hypothetical protein